MVLNEIVDRFEAGEFPNLHAVVVLHHGDLAFERHFEGRDQNIMLLASGDYDNAIGTYQPGSLHDLRSVTKSVTSLLYGIALAGGLVPPIDDPVFDAFPECADLRTRERDGILVRHLLTMTPGLEWDETISYTDERNSERQMWAAPDTDRYVLSRPVVSPPGEAFVYNGGATQVLASLIQKGTGSRLDDYARAVLFTPLGIADFEWACHGSGNPVAASGLRLRAADLAKIGLLYLSADGGTIVPAPWLRESLRPHVEKAANAAYGYQWWTSASGRVSSAMGNGGQRLFLVPEADFLAVVFAGNYDDPANACSDRVITEHLLPAAGLPPTDAWWTL